MIYTEQETMNAVPLTLEAHERAKDLARQQPTRYKAKQVYLNTLAVYAGKFYLQCWGFETEWEDCDSFSPTTQLLMDVADLEVKKFGSRLEFRPVLPDANVVHIPYDVWDDRMGYVAVQLDKSLRKATLLGFTKTVSQEEVPLSELHSLEALLDELYTINLREWLENQVDRVGNQLEDAWQTYEAFMQAQKPLVYARSSMSPRSQIIEKEASPKEIASIIRLVKSPDKEICRDAIGVLGEIATGYTDAIQVLTEVLSNDADEETRWKAALSLGKVDPGNPHAAVKNAKLIDLGVQLGAHQVGLIVAIMPIANDKLRVYVAVQPIGKTKTLPPNLKMSILSESGETRWEGYSRNDEDGKGIDSGLGWSFSRPHKSQFQVQLTLNNFTFTEKFIA